MPVTIKPSPKLAGCFVPSLVTSPELLLLYSDAELKKESANRPLRLRQTSLEPPQAVSPARNGFVHTIVEAFAKDLHLVLRPDDVWLAIITQFSYYVNNNAEELRHLFVAHEGKKDLEILAGLDSIWSYDMGSLAQKMTNPNTPWTNLIQENLRDADLREWLMPNFTTTTDIDKSVAAIVMMDTTQAYFNYSLGGGCGFPSVTLLGKKDDWSRILQKVRQLPKYGKPTEEWSKLLVPVIEHMVASFDMPESQNIKHFWLSAVHSAGEDGSGTVETLSGWLTAFCYFQKKTVRRLVSGGKIFFEEKLKESKVSAFSDEELTEMTKHGDSVTVEDRKRLVLCGIAYPIIRLKSIPQALCQVPVTVKDLERNLAHQTLMFAGSVGYTVKRSSKCSGEGFDTVQPWSGWWMIETGEPCKLPKPL